ncbi:DUF1232 domain-containing protein [Fibrobacter sp.]|uniref:DUF1232 domain-containing protein n=1 Tax=Fibrobacter sp. TaxID=35828 RepID=UPI003890EA46
MRNDDPEVHNMDEMNGRNTSRRRAGYRENTRGTEPSGASSLKRALSIVLALLALAYDASPVDLSPDAIPVLGWLDDAGFTVIALMNLAQQFIADQNSVIVKVLRYSKWIMVLLMVIAGILFLGFIAAIIALIKSLVG